MTLDLSLCASGDCPLRDPCERSPDVETPVDPHQSVTVYTWGVDDDGAPDCDAFRPRPEEEDVK